MFVSALLLSLLFTLTVGAGANIDVGQCPWSIIRLSAVREQELQTDGEMSAAVFPHFRVGKHGLIQLGWENL